MNAVIEELKQRITAIPAKVRRHHGSVDTYRQNRLFESNKDSFKGNKIRKKRDVMMITLWLKNRKRFEETNGVSLQTIRRMQSGYKTCQVKLMFKNRGR